MNLPIYRAKKIDSDEFVEGYLIDGRFIFKEWIDDVWTSFGETKSNKALVYEIDPTTLAIHFKDMLDSEGTKIFASLSDSGKGGDICDFPNRSPLTAMRNTMDNDFDFGNVRCFKNYHMDCKVIGIQE